jgi:hypothetical protein
MSDETKPKPKFEIVGEQPKGDNPSSVFDDLEGLRNASKLTIKRKTVLINVTVDRPANNTYFQAHSKHQLDATILREGDTRTYYFVVPVMRAHPKLMPRLRRVTLALICTWPGNVPIIWPVPIVSDGQREFKAWKSSRVALDLSHTQWVQIVWNEEAGDYDVETAENIDQKPVWPEKTFEELLKLAFDGKIIDNENHPYVRRLRGLVE